MADEGGIDAAAAALSLDSLFDFPCVSSGGRITEEELRSHVDLQRTLCFLCGPPPMIETLSKTLLDFGLPKDRILFEKWW